MKNLDARMAMSAQGMHVRAHSGRDPTVGTSRDGTPADAFEIVFRRMRNRASPGDPGVRDSAFQRSPRSAGRASPSPPRAKIAQLVRIQNRTRAGQANATREGELPQPRTEGFGTTMEARTPEAVLPREIVELAAVTARPTSPMAATVAPLVEEAVAGSIVAETEQFVPKPVAGRVVEQPVSESIAGLTAQQPVAASITGLAAEQVVPESFVELTFDMGGNGTAAPGDKAEFVMPLVDGALPGAEAIRFMHEPQQGVVRAGDMIASYPQQAGGEFPAGDAPASFVVDIAAHASDVLSAGDVSVRSQPHEAVGSAIGVLTEPSNGAAMPQLAPAQTVVNVTGVVREQLIDQIVRGVRVAQHNESTEVIVHLKPDFLGRLSIRVLADNHATRVEIRAGNEAVRQVMQDNLADLQQRLSEKGFAFDQFNVLADTGSNPQREPEWNFGAPPIARPGAALKALEKAPTEQAPPASTGVIDYFA